MKTINYKVFLENYMAICPNPLPEEDFKKLFFRIFTKACELVADGDYVQVAYNMGFIAAKGRDVTKISQGTIKRCVNFVATYDLWKSDDGAYHRGEKIYYDSPNQYYLSWSKGSNNIMNKRLLV